MIVDAYTKTFITATIKYVRISPKLVLVFSGLVHQMSNGVLLTDEINGHHPIQDDPVVYEP